nr:MAG TPA: hypothetical protein [Caudoviricetes sp.]
MGKLLGQTWEQLADIARQGTWAENNIEIGDYKALTLNGTVGTVALNNYTVYATVIGFDHNKDKEIVGYPHAITFGLFADAQGKQLALVDQYYASFSDVAASFTMNPGTSSTATNVGGWKKAKIRKNVLGSTDVESGDATSATITSPGANTFMAALPANLRALLKPITKYTDNVGNKSTSASSVTATIDYLPLLAEFEVFGSRAAANENEKTYQAQYQYYKKGNSKARYKYNDVSGVLNWWLRSPSIHYLTSFCYVTGSAASSEFSSSFSNGLAPIFNICSDGSPDYININQTTSTVVLATKDTHVSKDISVQAILSEKTVTPTSTAQTVTPSNNTVGLSKVTVNAVPTEEKTVTANGTVTPSSGKFLSKVTVNVPTAAPTLQAKTVNPTTSQQEVTADSGYDALSKVTVNAIQTETKSVTPTTSAQTVTPTSGKYLSSVSVGAIQTVEKTITMNGTYLPGDGKYFSQVVVNVAQSGVNAVKFIGTTWEPSTDYLPFDVTYTIETTNSTVVSVAKGTSAWILNAVGLGRATVTCHDSAGNQKGSYIVEVVAKEGFPIEVNTAVGMAEVLKASNVGKVYKFTGTTDSTYTNGDLYLVEET